MESGEKQQSGRRSRWPGIAAAVILFVAGVKLTAGITMVVAPESGLAALGSPQDLLLGGVLFLLGLFAWRRSVPALLIAAVLQVGEALWKLFQNLSALRGPLETGGVPASYFVFSGVTFVVQLLLVVPVLLALRDLRQAREGRL